MDSFPTANQLLAEVSEALFGAVRRGEAQRVDELLDAHPTVLERPDPGGQRPLMAALSEGHGKVVEVLLKRGANHSIPDMNGDSPLHVVAAKGNYEALRAFLKNVELPEINCTNKEGDSVLMGAAGRGFSIIVECLLQHDADPNIANQAGRTPVMEAARKGHKEVIKVLLRFGADILLTSYEDYSGMPTALREAVAFGSTDITSFVMQHCNKGSEKIRQLFVTKTPEEVDDLIRSGCIVNHRRGDGSTALMVHAESGNVHVVSRLLDAHAFMDAQDKEGQTALMKSSLRGRLEVVQEMVRRGALIDLKCKEGRTAVMYGVKGGNVEVTKFLTTSGADLTIIDNDGRTVYDIPNQKREISSFLKKKSSLTRIDKDPFTAMISQYLHMQKSPQGIEGKENAQITSSNSPSQQRRRHGGLEGPPESGRKAVGEPPSEEDPMKHQLNTYIKRVAELETRVEELTIRAEFSVIEEEDLSHYTNQPDRLIEEYKKLKTAKKKAEQFAIEAKQSAQKASVELTQLKEELVMEKHRNELRLKHMMSDMETKLASTELFQIKKEEMETAYNGIIRALENKRAPEEITRLKVQRMPTHTYTPEEVFDVIVNGNIKTRFKVTLVAVTGLPGSGKSTLVDKLAPKRNMHRAIGSTTRTQPLIMHEIGYCSTSHRESLTPEWGEFTREDIYMFMLTRALADRNRALPMLERWSYQNNLPTRCLKNDHLQKHFKNLYTKMQEGLVRFADIGSDFQFHLMSQPHYVLLNVWDIGFNKALLEALPLIARLMHPFVMLNVLNLSRDKCENLHRVPVKNNIQEMQLLMKRRSRGHYYVRTLSLCKPPGETVLIGTHRDKIPEEEVEKVMRMTEVGIRAKAGDVGTNISRGMLAVDLHKEEDCEHIKRCVEELMASTEVFNIDLQLTWIFLQTALVHYESDDSDFLMPQSEFDALAYECGLKSKEEAESCLRFFTKIGILMYSPEFFGNSIIYHPINFFRKFSALYDSVEMGNEHCKNSLSVGILCKNVAQDIWGQDKDFFWQAMQESGLAVATKVPDDRRHYDYEINCPYCNETDLLFVSTVRKGYFERTKKASDSLFITFNKQHNPMVVHIHFIKYLKQEIPDLKLKLTKYYNYTEFELPDGGCFKVIDHGDVVELEVTGYENNPKMETKIKGVIKSVTIKILEIVLKYFPGFKYEIALLCGDCYKLSENHPAPNSSTISYLHFLPIQSETKLYCRGSHFNVYGKEGDKNPKCNKMIELSEGQKRWMTLTGKEARFSTTDSECYEARVVPYSELLQAVKLIPLDCYEPILTTLSPGRTSNPYSEETIVTVLTDWQKQSLSNRRERLTKILLRMGCYKAAIKLDAKLFNATVEEVPQNKTLSAVEMEIICNCAIQWRQLATELGLTQNQLREISQLPCTSDRERCRRVLQVFSTEPDARNGISQALHKMGWTTAANSLKSGYTDRYI